jgi:hypothetical protein
MHEGVGGMGDGEHDATQEGLVAWTRLRSEGWRQRTFRGADRDPDKGDEDKSLRGKDPFPAFLVEVESDTPIGRELLRDPLSVLRKIDVDIPDRDVRAMVLRVNAEIPANPRHRSELWMLIPGSTTVVGIQFKHND